MTIQRCRLILILGVAATLAACAAPKAVAPPPVVATLPPPPAPVMPVGGFPGMRIPAKLPDGRFATPNVAMTDAAAVWHLRGALNVAALGCDQAGGGTVEPYNNWLRTRSATLAAFGKQYLSEWEITGWGDWQDAYDNHQTRLYNFYSDSAMRWVFCPLAARELVGVALVPDAELPAHARAALARLDQPFIEFFTQFDNWRDYYQPEVTPPPVVATLPQPIAPPPIVATIPPAVAPPRLVVPAGVLDGS